jgi:hypothetical protein
MKEKTVSTNSTQRWCCLIAAAVLAAGCSPSKPASPTKLVTKSETKEGHDHAEHGPHGGILAEWPPDYHAEVTFDHRAKQAVVYLLDSTAKRAARVEPNKVSDMMLTITNVQPPVSIPLKHDAAKSGDQGLAFVGTHDVLGKEMDFKGNVGGKLGMEPYTGEFDETAHGHDHPKGPDKSDKHGAHGPGGVPVTIADGRYHAEAIVHRDGSIHLVLLARDYSRLLDVDEQTVTGYIRAMGDAEFTCFELKPQPQPGDAEGRTSRFVGQVPAHLKSKPLEVTVLGLKVGAERYRLAFQTVERHGDGHGSAALSTPPSGLDDEQRLFLTAGGIYSEQDILANGRVTASVKFKAFSAKHDFKPVAGDKICPITRTKANPQCTWVVNGKLYEFCCPPCVEEFVKLAKDEPEAIREPSEYIKK